MAKSDAELARQSFMQVVNLYPDHQKTPDALYKLGVVYHSLGDLESAKVFLARVQGESNTVGLPTVFVRLTGCPLRCGYCDSAYAFSGGSQVALSDILAQVQSYQVPRVTVTGGEPLAQPEVHELMSGLCELGMSVSLETSGALDITAVDSRVTKVVDLKTPDSGESHRNLWANIQRLSGQDQIKFVLCSRSDYEWAKLKIGRAHV